jgi:catechol 2,3-dioxygenase-like lactoylglutathione lyase family enzyme
VIEVDAIELVAFAAITETDVRRAGEPDQGAVAAAPAVGDLRSAPCDAGVLDRIRASRRESGPRPAVLATALHVTIAQARLDVARVPSRPGEGWLRELSKHPTLCSADMTLQRMDNVLIVVDDLEAAKAFFAELGMELEGEATNEGRWVDRVVGLNDVRADIAMMRTPDGHGGIELTKFHTPPAVRAEPESAPANTLGIRRIMFAVDDIDDVVARLRSHGAELVGEIAQYEDVYRLCFLRGPEGVIVGLAERLS